MDEGGEEEEAQAEAKKIGEGLVVGKRGLFPERGDEELQQNPKQRQNGGRIGESVGALEERLDSAIELRHALGRLSFWEEGGDKKNFRPS